MRAGLVAKFANELQIEFSAGDHINEQASVIVVGKIGGDCQNGRDNLWTKQLSKSNQQSKRIILDYTDHHLGVTSSPMATFYTNILPISHGAAVSSTGMAKLLAQCFSQEINVIEDPIEIPVNPPSISSPTAQTTLLWFGHATNTPYLVNYLLNNFLCDADFRLIALSNGAGLEILALNQPRLRSNITLHLAEWSLQNMVDASKVSHGCVIPSNLNDPRKSGASSNRLITAFALGLPVSADLLESYVPFSDYFHNIREEPLSIFIENGPSYSKKVGMAQEIILPIFSEKVLAQKWRNLFLAAAAV